MSKKTLIIKCAKCHRITAGFLCSPGGEEMVGESVMAVANRGDVIEVTDGPVTLHGCNCKEQGDE